MFLLWNINSFKLVLLFCCCDFSVFLTTSLYVPTVYFSLFIQQTEYLLFPRPVLNIGDTAVNKAEMILAFVELTVYCERCIK